MSVVDLEATFPNLVVTGYRITSPESIDYNCLAWAAGDQVQWWQPEDGNPTGIPFYWHQMGLTSTIDAYVAQYRAEGFEVTDSGEFEADFERIAIYVNAQNEPTHAARQLDNAHWTSKCGEWEDIEHTLAGLESNLYGTVHLFMKKRRP